MGEDGEDRESAGKQELFRAQGSSPGDKTLTRELAQTTTLTGAQTGDDHWQLQAFKGGAADEPQVFHLIFGIVSSGQVHKVTAELINNSQNCYAQCPRGYYNRSPCNGQAGKYLCEKCGNDTYTGVNNTYEECFRCTPCPLLEEETEECAFNSNRKCDCKTGYYKKDSVCVKCGYCNDAEHSDCKCQPCLRKICLNNPECKRKCEAFFNQLSTTATTTLTTAAQRKSTKEGDNLMLWLLAVVAAVLVVVVWLLLLFTKNMLRKDERCLPWSADKNLPVEDQKCKEQHSHQGSSPTTLTIKVCEEAPLMPLNQSAASQAHLTFTSRFLPDTDHTAARHEELSDHWPAIVLYTIIKAVPLRRWKEFLRLLSVADHEMERVELDAGSAQGFIEKQYQMLRLWSERSSAGMGDVFSALHYMDLSGYAQLLQESLEKLPWRSELKQGPLTCRGPTDCGLSGAMQDTLVSVP